MTTEDQRDHWGHAVEAYAALLMRCSDMMATILPDAVDPEAREKTTHELRTAFEQFVEVVGSPTER